MLDLSRHYNRNFVIEDLQLCVYGYTQGQLVGIMCVIKNTAFYCLTARKSP